MTFAATSNPSGYRPSSPKTAEFCAFLCTPRIERQNERFSFSHAILLNDLFSICFFWSETLSFPGPQISDPYKAMGLINWSNNFNAVFGSIPVSVRRHLNKHSFSSLVTHAFLSSLEITGCPVCSETYVYQAESASSWYNILFISFSDRDIIIQHLPMIKVSILIFWSKICKESMKHPCTKSSISGSSLYMVSEI